MIPPIAAGLIGAAAVLAVPGAARAEGRQPYPAGEIAEDLVCTCACACVRIEAGAETGRLSVRIGCAVTTPADPCPALNGSVCRLEPEGDLPGLGCTREFVEPRHWRAARLVRAAAGPSA
ncbi:hypothetical protein LNKW23_02670 [Paralimibaculum aggregatum]|uniref:Secreted protein n=1 Tax=Paralimibaculum aggregatum TaxID=3036245 RepID=A0ABQ6LL94_9RHOB|nr:hypothetical protein [Limibaculum sp. NKW23]GMG81055.1 hypothetical protein LNKW23_02670 [Limibaculum sp. NKW23]